MYAELRTRAKKAGQAPGTAVYTGKLKTVAPQITMLIYSEHACQEVKGKTLDERFLQAQKEKEHGVTWTHVQGLHDVALIEQLAKEYRIHPLTVEDILNIDQRPKVEEYEEYVFITLKMFQWDKKHLTFSTEQISFILGKGYLLSFQEHENSHFQHIQELLSSSETQRMRQQGSDYLAYRLMDSIIDYYFVVLEGLGDQIEQVEEAIIANPQTQHTRTIYQLKRELMMLRKSIWPMREAISHLSQIEAAWITPFTRIYLRDLYDHIVQAIDTVETFRDMLSSMLDVYLSSITNRMNETMKTLTIIATIFIPITFIASLYGMNFVYMPELKWHWGYFTALGVMTVIVLIMLNYFRRKKWL